MNEHKPIWDRTWQLIFGGIAVVGTLIGWAYFMHCSCASAAAEAREKAILNTQTTVHLKEQIQSLDPRLKNMEESLRNIDARLSRMEGRMGIGKESLHSDREVSVPRAFEVSRHGNAAP